MSMIQPLHTRIFKQFLEELVLKGVFSSFSEGHCHEEFALVVCPQKGLFPWTTLGPNLAPDDPEHCCLACRLLVNFCTILPCHTKAMHQ